MSISTVEVAAGKPAAGIFWRVADRWIYVFMAALFVIITLVGFIPDSLGMLRAVEAGERPPLPPVLHAHAVLMGSWLLLLLAQTTLMATGHGAQHQKLGLLATVLLPLIILAMAGVVHSTWSWIAAIPATAMPPDALSGLKATLSNILLVQSRILVLFPVLVTWAVLVRREDPESHKRFMIFAALIPLPAAIDRMTWLPNSFPESPASVHLYTLLVLLPVLVYDLARRGRIHRAYLIGLALNAPFVVAAHMLWNSPWWLAVAPRLVGVEGW